MASPAAAEIRLGSEAGGFYNVRVMSWAEIPFRTVVRQQYDFSCGSAAVATLLTYHYDQPTAERVAFAEMWRAGDQAAIRKVGFSMFDMKTYLDSLGYRAEGFRMGIEDLQRTSLPMIVLLDINGFKHFAVVKGLRGDRILLGDPALGLTEYPVAEFEAMWNNIALVVTDTPGDMPPQFNRAGDWGPWSRAPIGEGTAPEAVGALTTHLPPVYQITPEFLLEFNGGS
ncbi:peptidase C39 [Altererythrobacter soli]|uniref:Peptidase C39 n=1 Tax=Croceibacterium soli TaxID=1739690 RepID=A0A6I4UTE5_9SPHN|nr:C39 family peptidase [Croceibacterium soli]MXP41908.1 peptidase C39 [Croceibacterium soli]